MKTYRLNVDLLFDGNDNNPRISDFIEQFGAVIYGGKGGVAKFLGNLKIRPDFSLQCLVGIPENEFSPDKKALVEAYCMHILDIDGYKAANIWTADRIWRPINPKRTPCDLGDSVIDVDWMTSLGLVRGRWETYILQCSSTILMRQDRFPKREDMFIENTRLLLALATYGFIDPWQFFIENKRR